MKLESYAMSDNEVLRALTMFVDEKWDDGKFHLISTESIAEDEMGLTAFIKANSNTEVPQDILVQMEKFAMQFDSDWQVYVLYMKGEVSGLIAFSDWC